MFSARTGKSVKVLLGKGYVPEDRRFAAPFMPLIFLSFTISARTLLFMIHHIK